ncbi:MAG: heavy-metal-associated domain-containing protein [Planctomycetota bacterium]|nr:MAG: heavy-metal-associated domain-containing protein [Planctomycetota bacterium]
MTRNLLRPRYWLAALLVIAVAGVILGPPTLGADPPGNWVEMRVEGIECGLICAPKVRRLLRQFPWIGEVQVDHARDWVRVELLQEDAELQPMLDALNDAGFPARFLNPG